MVTCRVMSATWWNSFLSSPGGTQFWQLPTGESAFWEVQEFSREAPVHHWRKISGVDTWRWLRRTVLFYPHCSSSKVAQLSAKKDLVSWLATSPLGESESVWVNTWLPQLCGETHFFLTPSRILKWAAWLGGGLGEQQPGLSEGSRKTWILLSY